MRVALFFVAATVASSCTLRHRYLDLVKPDAAGPEARFVLLDADSNQPLAGVKYEMSEWKNVVRGSTAADGTFALPVAKKYADENPVFAVALPAGVKRYRIEAPKPPEPLNPPQAPAAVSVPTEASKEAAPMPDPTPAPAVNNEAPAPSQR